MHKIHEKLGPAVCRRCICAAFRVDLLPRDVDYDRYPQACSGCGNVSNIVVGLHTSGKLKLLFKS